MKKFIQQHKYELILFVVLISISIFTGIKAYKTTDFVFDNAKFDSYIVNTSSPNNFITSSLSNGKYQTVNKFNESGIRNKELGSTTTVTSPQITTYSLEASNYNLSPTSTVYDLMRRAEIDSRRPFLFKSKTYSGIGEFVEEINGLKNNPQTGEYWIYYINENSAKMGISQQIVKPNDVITWKYETSTL